nr:hypothetical protein CFP56_07504 [Quercus suber]
MCGMRLYLSGQHSKRFDRLRIDDDESSRDSMTEASCTMGVRTRRLSQPHQGATTMASGNAIADSRSLFGKANGSGCRQDDGRAS